MPEWRGRGEGGGTGQGSLYPHRVLALRLKIRGAYFPCPRPLVPRAVVALPRVTLWNVTGLFGFPVFSRQF